MLVVGGHGDRLQGHDGGFSIAASALAKSRSYQSCSATCMMVISFQYAVLRPQTVGSSSWSLVTQMR
jgi:hypothetical protein